MTGTQGFKVLVDFLGVSWRRGPAYDKNKSEDWRLQNYARMELDLVDTVYKMKVFKENEINLMKVKEFLSHPHVSILISDVEP